MQIKMLPISPHAALWWWSLAIEEEGEEDSEPIEASEDEAKAKSYGERLRAAGIPFSDYNDRQAAASVEMLILFDFY